MPILLALRRLKEENSKFRASLGYTVRLCLKETHRKKSKKMF